MSTHGRDHRDLSGMLIHTRGSRVLVLTAAILPVGLPNIRPDGGFDIILGWVEKCPSRSGCQRYVVLLILSVRPELEWQPFSLTAFFFNYCWKWIEGQQYVFLFVCFFCCCFFLAWQQLFLSGRNYLRGISLISYSSYLKPMFLSGSITPPPASRFFGVCDCHRPVRSVSYNSYQS